MLFVVQIEFDSQVPVPQTIDPVPQYMQVENPQMPLQQ
jgi:hypothetical protein